MIVLVINYNTWSELSIKINRIEKFYRFSKNSLGVVSSGNEKPHGKRRNYARKSRI